MKDTRNRPVAPLIRFHFDEHIAAGSGGGIASLPFAEAPRYSRPNSLFKFCTWLGNENTGRAITALPPGCV